MLNEHDEKYEGSEESEYHFSDEETGYEADPDAAKPVVVASEKSALANLSQSKRMLISLGVFFALVFVVYKMVTPSASTQTTDITPAATQAAAPMASAAKPAMPMQQSAVSAPPSQAPSSPPPAAPPASMTAAVPTTPQEALTQEASAGVGVQQAAMTAPPASAAPASTTTMPNVIPVPTTPASPEAPPQATNTPLMNNIDTRAAQVAATNEQLMAQLQAEYTQRLADYQAQNKTLQDQVQTLNTRVASMETEMSQLIQTLTKQFQNGGAAADISSTEPNAPPAAIPTDGSSGQGATSDMKLPYSVQAIIPGRAWLRADNGDTLTVAEGDIIKDVGTVTKIDPYDGTVQIKVGNKTVTLSYGNGG